MTIRIRQDGLNPPEAQRVLGASELVEVGLSSCPACQSLKQLASVQQALQLIPVAVDRIQLSILLAACLLLGCHPCLQLLRAMHCSRQEPRSVSASHAAFAWLGRRLVAVSEVMQ